MILKKSLIPAKKWPLEIIKWIEYQILSMRTITLFRFRECEVLSDDLGNFSKKSKMSPIFLKRDTFGSKIGFFYR